MTRRVMRVGHSLCIVIPSHIAEMMGVKERDEVDLRFDGRRTLSVRAADKRVRRFTPKMIAEGK
jgi:antitoxin component of MazEF toxin-antitoxin module